MRPDVIDTLFGIVRERFGCSTRAVAEFRVVVVAEQIAEVLRNWLMRADMCVRIDNGHFLKFYQQRFNERGVHECGPQIGKKLNIQEGCVRAKRIDAWFLVNALASSDPS